LIYGENIMAIATAMQRRLIRTKEAATYLSVSEWKLRRLIQDGAIPFVQDHENAPFLLDVRDLDAYIESNKHSAADLINMPPLPAISSRGETREHRRRVE
jgi:excisionase family DNA binding protein